MSLLHLDIIHLIKTVGYLGLFLTIFAESGLFFGFFLPGGSLLFTAGLLASEGYFNIWILVGLLGVAAVLGDSVGYWFGKKVGPAIFNREDSRFFHKKHLNQAHDFFESYGTRAVVIARFVPIVRTFVPILAGVGSMQYKKFLTYNVIGALSWAVGVALLGYFLGRSVPGIDHYLTQIVLLIIVLSLLPLVKEWWTRRPKNGRTGPST